ncbi:DUF1998 domain-containing protein [Actinomadura sp. NBRC 104412]|uniref:DUF1998 domain-containing protein n=1 Tax=Actinomadura sp. NBRC 104412 TaxID=3032203 RepID=UPI002555F878|nr:DUF1998 domain-containing protein [Actinomadura sp. NBRC 104412]
MRRAQMITTYGVGSLVAIGDQSYVVSGLDSWKVDVLSAIYEPRLERWLGVNGFQPPPAAAPPAGDGVRVRLFPEFYSCPTCHDLKEFRKFGSPRGKSRCGACDKPLTPSRFVIACENGHLDDFPYFDWVHKKTSPAGSSFEGRHELSLHSGGRTASLRSVIIRCTCGKEASMEGAFGRHALSRLGIPCRGRRPWLGRGTEQEGCTALPRTLQRGSSAAWFPVNRSALSIPPWSETLQKRINPHYQTLKTLLEQRVDHTTIEQVIRGNGILRDSRFTSQDVIEAVQRRQRLMESEQPDADTYEALESATELRREEYEQLRFGTATIDRGDDFECTRPPEDPDTPLPPGIERSMLVTRLREVRALQSFTRVEVPDPVTIGDRKAAMSKEKVDWLPAIEVSGEGVFLTLDARRLNDWETRAGTSARAGLLRDNHTAALRRRAVAVMGRESIGRIRSPLSPRYILIHTLAHALINEWSLEAGYPAASLRERLYVSNDMAGLLIYTATSDSAGSLGGVVAQGEYKRLHESVKSALSRVSWCSQDPPCMESEASGVDSLNLAACYACVLLPETSCETNNIFLDRAMLIGTPDDPSVGYFATNI